MALDATLRRSELLRRLRELRKAAGKTQAQVGTFLNCSQGKINKIETGETMVKLDDLDQLLQLYGVAPEERAELRELTTMSISASPGRRPGKAFVELLELERQAKEVLALHSERVPKPLQSQRYLLSQHQEALDYTKPATLLQERRKRAEFLTLTRPRYRVILSESALDRMPGGRTATKVIDQAQYLLDIGNQHDNVEIQILTYGARIPFLDPDITILRFADGRKELAYAEYAGREDVLRTPQDVAERIAYWEQVHKVALGVDSSREFLLDLIDQAKTGRKKWRYES